MKHAAFRVPVAGDKGATRKRFQEATSAIV
jgi:hypothetical protein